MVDPTWLIVAFYGGAFLGMLLVSLCVMGREDEHGAPPR